MRKFINSPLTRISIGLAMLTISLLLSSEFFGFLPDAKNSELQTRKVITEMLAIQLSVNLRENQRESLRETLKSVVERNNNVLSGAIRLKSGKVLFESGTHQKNWTLNPGEKSTTQQVQVSLFQGAERWGNVELRFDALSGNKFFSKGSFVLLLIFITLVGFPAYRFYLKRVMRELNPDAVIPERVRKALDTLAEGLLIIDTSGVINFSNAAFANKTGLSPEQLVGRESASLDWEVCADEKGDSELPWLSVMKGDGSSSGMRLKLKTPQNKNYTFTVNVSPIAADAGEIKGALITFDDITALEIKNEELNQAFIKLEDSQKEIVEQNQKLLLLATRDPLTDVLNRRSLFEGFDLLLASAQQEEAPLSCIMVDIDHFKAVNDNYGHSIGDEVIKLLANILTKYSGANDLVGRFGGEEFVVVIPDGGIDVAMTTGETIRRVVEQGDVKNYPDIPQITSSFGVATLTSDIDSAKALLDLADAALYVAKENGRNQVIAWSETMDADAKQQNGNVPALPEVEAIKSVSEVSTGLVNAAQSEKVSCPPDRLLLINRISHAISRIENEETRLAILMVNIESLKRMNDSLGVLSAEKFSKIIISRIKEALLDVAVANTDKESVFSVQRLNNNEIAVLLSSLDKADRVTRYVYHIFSANKEPILLEGRELYLNTNIGISFYPSDGRDPDVLISNAGSALQEANRKQERNNFQFYSDEFALRTKKLVQLEAALHHALERGELVVHYQPKVSLQTGMTVGMEALLRWNNPELGAVPPGEFIPVAEQAGLIHEIGKWVFHQVCCQIKIWQEAGHNSITVSINLSPIEFRNPDLADQIISYVREMDLPPQALGFEIRQMVVMQGVDAAEVLLKRLDSAGFVISLDGFGTGYSSLSYLKRFPVSRIKIDRSFISDALKDSGDAAIIRALITMSHSLGLLVVAEGVEAQAQLNLLQDLKCDEVQGYLFGGAMSSDKATSFLADTSSVRQKVFDSGEDEFVEPMTMNNVFSGALGAANDGCVDLNKKRKY
ncbi:MAG: EAL domain-containing protein [Gammaproteobacteria bacterium]|nr:EAL domain-containing protein [Gammaproteobacteria bacterium]